MPNLPIGPTLLLALSILLSACGARPAAQATPTATLAPAAPPALRVLFIGNSLTYTNDLPAMAAAMVGATDLPPLAYATVAFPDFALADHWDQGEALRQIAAGGWDYVVLQQGPSALPESRTILRADAARFAALIRDAGATPALYAVWPMIGRFGDFPRVGESYQLAAEDVGGVLIPAGEAWRAAWRRDPCLDLYDPDGLHPAPVGTYLAALVTIARLYGRPAAGLPIPSEISRDQAILLQEAADEALGAAGPAPGPVRAPGC